MNRTEQQKNLEWKAVDRGRARFVNEYEKKFLKALNLQFAPVLVAVRAGKEKPEEYVLELPISEAFKDLYLKVGVSFARESYRRLKSFKADEPESVWIRFMRRFAIEEAGERIKAITDTTRKFVRNVLEKAVGDGLSIENTANLMKDEFQGINKTRAKLISRTEIINSSNAGSLLGAQSTGLKLNKEWLATRDGRTRSSHSNVDGQIVALDANFSVNGYRLAHPGDSSKGAPAEETIQCRCTQVFNPV